MDGAKLIPLAQISPSPTNPRQVGFTPADLAELTASIKASGVLYPITVRIDPNKPMLDGKGKELPVPYELVDGERRFRAAMFAGLAEVPAVVTEMTDEQVRDAQLVSFDQKVDLLPSERAAAYQREIDAGRTADELAAKVGRSVSFVRNVLRIAKLSDDFLAHVDAGRVPRATAELVARVPGERARKTVELCVLQDTWPQGVSAKGKPAEEPKTYRETRRLIEQEFMVELKGAAFNPDDPTLLPKAGTCQACPSRAGNAGEEYKSVRADVCLDPECYRAKLGALRKREEAEAKKGGRKVLPKAEAEKVFWRHGGMKSDAPYQDLNDRCYQDRKNRTYGEIVGKAVADQVVIGYDHDGGRHELAPKAVVTKALKAAGFKLTNPHSHSAPKRTPAQIAAEGKRKAEEALRNRTDQLLLGELAVSAEGLFGAVLPKGNRTVNKVLRAVLGVILEEAYGEELEWVRDRRGWPKDTRGHQDYAADLEAKLTDLDGDQLLGLLVEVSCAGTFHADEHRKTLAEALVVDRKALEKRAKKELEAAAREKMREEAVEYVREQAQAGTKRQPSANGHAAKPKKRQPAGV